MTGTTPIYSIPYPEDGDPLADIPDYMQAQAEQVESTIAGFGGIASPGSWTGLSYGGGWADAGGSFEDGEWRKVGNQLFIRGLVSRSVVASGAPSTIAVLPVGSRPLGYVTYPCAKSESGTVNETNVITVTPAGLVQVNSNINVGGWVALNSPTIWLD